MQEFIDHVLPLYDVVSFDIFDTFLLRPFLAPGDLFSAIGGNQFRGARTAAERDAIAEKRVNTTIDDIYAKMPKTLLGMRDVEIAEERRRAVVNPDMLKAYTRAKELGKKVVFVSDMYLPENILRDILLSKGVSGWDGLYSSCSRGCTKKDGGRLFSVMTSDIGVRPQDVVHIGDDRHGDIEGGSRAGVYPYYYHKIAHRLFEDNPAITSFMSRCGNDTHASLMLGALALSYHITRCEYGDDPWRRCGVIYTSPIYYNYAMFIVSYARRNKKTQLLLVLRDGYAIGRILGLIAPEMSCIYVYASRSVVYPVLYGGPGSHAESEFRKYLDASGVDASNAVIVDGPSVRRSAERAICSALKVTVPAVYLMLPESTQADDSAYIPGRCNCIVLEALGGAPSYPCAKLVDGVPAFTEKTKYDEYHIGGQQRKFDAYANTATLLHDNGVVVSGSSIRTLIDCFFNTVPLRDMSFFMRMRGNDDAMNVRYRTVYWK